MEEDYELFAKELADVEAKLRLEPSNVEWQDLRAELLDGMKLIEDVMPHLKDAPVASKQRKDTTTVESRPEQTTAVATSDSTRFFQSGDQVQARRRGEPFAPATVLSVLGPHTKPNYVVRFRADRATATVPGHDVRPLSTSVLSTDTKKRKIEQDESSAQVSQSANAGNVISAPAALNPEFLKQKELGHPSLDEQGREKKSRKVGNVKRLETNRSSWQSFQGNLSRKQKSKDSMFRTGDGVHARVGVIGSGQGMRKDQKRQKNEYTRVDDEDE